MSRGFVVYQGPSSIDNRQIVVIITRKSENPKTGPMAQAWILRANQAPEIAVQTGANRSICGRCLLRPKSGTDFSGQCYVSTHQAPNRVWHSWKHGLYPVTEDFSFLANQPLRMGAYGDPTAAPFDLWHRLSLAAPSHTGYTHLWRTCDARFKRLLMASTETEQGYQEAIAKGWRAFHMRPFGVPVPKGMVNCPASEEGGRKTTCYRCSLCSGNQTKKPSVSIINHHGAYVRVVKVKYGNDAYRIVGKGSLELARLSGMPKR